MGKEGGAVEKNEGERQKIVRGAMGKRKVGGGIGKKTWKMHGNGGGGGGGAVEEEGGESGTWGGMVEGLEGEKG